MDKKRRFEDKLRIQRQRFKEKLRKQKKIQRWTKGSKINELQFIKTKFKEKQSIHKQWFEDDKNKDIKTRKSI